MRKTAGAITAIAALSAGLAAATLAQPSAAAAATTSVVSSNWAGYAVTGVRFRRVSGTWTVPHDSCSARRDGYSATWIGIGGFSENSTALEQTGTELDCRASGKASYSAWYELVPAAAKTIRMTVRPGDQMSAVVAVSGMRVSITLRNVTRGKSFARTLTMSAPDVTSAEWIVEAPSGCSSSGNCTQLPLADFGTVQVKRARAVSRTGHAGPISDTAWAATKLALSEADPRFTSTSGTGALASALSSGGSVFSVSYQGDATLAKPEVTLPVMKRAAG